MRTKQQVLKDYLNLINKEQALGYTEQEINTKLEDTEESAIIERLILEEIYAVEFKDEVEVATERAFYIWCAIIIKYDFKTQDEFHTMETQTLAPLCRVKSPCRSDDHDQ